MMMVRTVHILIVVVVVMSGVNLWAQQKAGSKADSKQPANGGHKVLLPAVYLGHSDLRGGAIKKDAFITLMKQGLSSHDDAGIKYTITGFDFSYAERKLYEDSAGNKEVLMDMSSEYCQGDTLASDIAYAPNMLQSGYLNDSADIPKGLYERIKPGDTLYFDHVRLVKCSKNAAKLQLSDTATIAGKGMKFFIAK